MIEIKCHPQYFEEVVARRKLFEIRKNDRDYKPGQRVRMREWNPDTQAYTGRVFDFTIGYLTDYDQKPGFVVFSITKGKQRKGKP